MKKQYILLFILSLFVVSNVYALTTAEILEANTKLYYKMEENGAVPYVDAVGNLNLTVGNVPDRTTGIINFGQDFEKTNLDYLITSATTIQNSPKWSFDFWMKTESSTAIAGLIDFSEYTGDYTGCLIQYRDTNIFRIDCFKGAGSTYFSSVSSTTLADGVWAYITVTYDGTEVDIFINNTEVAYSTHGGGVVNTATAVPFRVGIEQTDTSRTFDGIIDEVGFYNFTMTATYRAYRFNSGAPTSAQQYPFTAPSTPSLSTTLVYPINNTHYNNYNGSVILSSNLNANCSINDTRWTLSSTGGTAHRFQNNTVINYGNQSVAVTCTRLTNTSIKKFWFVIDAVMPTATVNFVNNSIQANPFNLSVLYYDEYIYRTNTTIYRKSDNKKLYNNYSGDLPYHTYNYTVNYPINILNSTYIVGDYIIVNVNAADTHTAGIFEEKPKSVQISLFDKNVKDYQLKYGDVRFEYDKDMQVTELYGYDRMNFKLSSSKLKGKSTYKYIEADKIVYYENSEYPCHMIINDKYWYDCVGMKEPKVTKDKDNRYRIDFIMDKSEVITKSLGGLNEINANYTFKINKNYTGNINIGDFFDPPNASFNYTANTNFVVSSLLLNETCIQISGSSVPAYDDTYCYDVDKLELEDVVLFYGSTPVDCYINISNMPGDIITVYYDWYNKNDGLLDTGFTLVDSGTYSTLDELPGALTSYNNSVMCRARLSNSWFNFTKYTPRLSTSSVSLCDALNIYPIVNISYADESSGNTLRVTSSYSLTFSDGDSTFTVTSNNTGNYSTFCTDVNPATAVFNLNMYGSVILSSSGYISRAFILPPALGTIVSNNPYTNLTYFLIQVANSTTITYNWQTTNFQAIDGTMQIYRCEPDGSKTFIDSTAISGGQAAANLQLYTTAYSYSVIYQDTLYTESSYYACHIESLTTKQYYIDTMSTDILPVIGLFSVDCNLEKIAPTIVKMSWTSNIYDSSDITACIVGYRQDIYNKTEVYRSCTNASSGSLTRDVSVSTSTYYISGEIEQNGNKGVCRNNVVFFAQSDTSSLLGVTGLFAIALLIISLAFLYAGEGELTIVGALVGVFIAWLLGILSMPWIIVSGIVIFGVGIIIIGRYTKVNYGI